MDNFICFLVLLMIIGAFLVMFKKIEYNKKILIITSLWWGGYSLVFWYPLESNGGRPLMVLLIINGISEILVSCASAYAFGTLFLFYLVYEHFINYCKKQEH